MTQGDGRPQFAAHPICMFHSEFVDMPRANCPLRIAALGTWIAASPAMIGAVEYDLPFLFTTFKQKPFGNVESLYCMASVPDS